MMVWAFINRVIQHISRTKGAAYAVAAYDMLDVSVRKAVTEDLKRYLTAKDPLDIEKDPKKYLKTHIVQSPVFRTQFYSRCLNCCGDIPSLRPVVDTCSFFLPPHPGLEISAKRIGDGLQIFHAPVLIGKNAVIGEHVSIGSNVVIGQRQRMSPVIHDNVLISAGAIILGGIEIGENAIIGAGALVIKDVPPNTVYAGVPAKFLHPVTGKESAKLQDTAPAPVSSPKE